MASEGKTTAPRGPIVLAAEPDFDLNGLRVRPSAGEVERAGAVERLEPRVMQVLIALAQAQGQVVSRDTLLARCWDGAVVTDHAVNRTLSRLRRLSEVDGGAPFHIETLSKLGYRLTTPMSAAAPAPARAQTWSEAAPTPARSKPRGRALGLVGLAVAVAAGLAALVLARPPAAASLAVLEFRAVDPARHAGFAHTLAERIRAVMSVSDLAPAARLDAEALRGPAMTRAAAQAGVRFVLDGSVAAEGDALVVNMLMIDARRNRVLWSKRYARAAAEGTWLEGQIAAHAAEILRCALRTRDASPARTGDDALSVFLRACDAVQRFDGAPAAMMEGARAVTRADPDFSRGWSLLALAAAYASRIAAPEEAQDLRAQSAAAADRALALDRENGEAFLARAVAAPMLGAWAEREALIEEALRREPDSARALQIKAEWMTELGRIEEALGLLERSLALEPLAPDVRAATIPLLATLGRRDEARAVADELGRTWPQSASAQFNRLNFRIFAGEYAEALALIASGEVPAPPLIVNYVRARAAGDQAALRRAIDAIATAAAQGRWEYASAVALAASAGEVDTAFALTEAYFARTPTVRQPTGGAGRYFLFVGATESMRADPRFGALLQKLGHAEEWRRSGRKADFCATAPQACALD